jgi:DNA-binding response OmpR family regulator
MRTENDHGQEGRHARAVAHSMGIGGVIIDPKARAVAGGGRFLQLTRKEFAVLYLLVERRGEVLTRRDILECLYDDGEEPDLGVVGVFICTLRKKLGAAGAPGLIGTVRGYGYVIRETALEALQGGYGHPDSNAA